MASNPSYWVTSVTPSAFPELDRQIEVDVAIVGGGIVGVVAARLLKKAGKTVALVEMNRIGHGVTGYTTAKISSTQTLMYQRLERKHGLDVARAYAASQVFGLAEIRRLVEDEGIECDLEPQDNYVYCEDEDDVPNIEAEVAAARRAGLHVELVRDTALPFPVAAALRHPDQAQFHPVRFLRHLAQGIPGEGSHVFENSRALDVDEGQPLTVACERGGVAARDLIIATNYPFLDRGLYFPRVHPQRSYAIAGVPDPSLACEGMYISSDQPTRSIRTIRDGSRSLLSIGGEGHAVGQEHDTEERYPALEAWAAERFGMREITHRWSTQDGITVDGLPYIGRYRRTSDHVYTATGFAKWGMANGAMAAGLLTDLICERHNEWAGLFDPHRLTVTASAEKLITENAKVAMHWTRDRIAHPQSTPFEDLAPGQGSVRREGTKLVAASRSDDGTLVRVSAVCTHLGCVVAWNEAESSWDCPCHGSRFAADGSVIQGPAVHDLPTADQLSDERPGSLE